MLEVKTVDPSTLKEWLSDGGELALLDVRDLRPYSRAHIWLAISLPYACLELRVQRFVPRLTARLVLCDDDDGLAARAAAALVRIGYSNISILEGGVGGWRDEGYDLINGNYVIAHSFGYFLKTLYDLPTIGAEELQAKLEAGEDLVILDVRPPEDHRRASLPRSINAPAAELLHRLDSLLLNPNTQIVVHCAGVTRGVLAAQALKVAEIGNPVWFLQDGTKGWLAAGHTLQVGTVSILTQRATESWDGARALGKNIALRYDLRYISPDELALRQAEVDRTTYLVDVRSPEEFAASHFPGAYSVPGGELAGMTIDHLATRNARLCIVSDAESGRAEITALWMLHQGWPDVMILRDWRDAQGLVRGPEPDISWQARSGSVAALAAQALSVRIESENAVILDFAPSRLHESGHVPGAFWLLRSDLPKRLDDLPAADSYVVTSPDGRSGQLIAEEMQALVTVPVLALSGGTTAWHDAGYELETGLRHTLSPIDDFDEVMGGPQEKGRSSTQTFHARYNSWRRNLFDLYKEQGLAEFRDLGLAPQSR